MALMRTLLLLKTCDLFKDETTIFLIIPPKTIYHLIAIVLSVIIDQQQKQVFQKFDAPVAAGVCGPL